MIEVLFFAELREAVGQEKVTVEAAGYTIKQLKNQWLKRYELETIDNAMVAINEEYAKEDDILAAGDIVAFIPPVSGG